VDTEERTLDVAMVLAGAPPVIGATITHATFGGGVSLCLGMVALGLVGIIARRRKRTPKARIHVRR
jgi:VIT1/CCC1 family predicted Fe2+/Mn2+ transporter